MVWVTPVYFLHARPSAQQHLIAAASSSPCIPKGAVLLTIPRRLVRPSGVVTDRTSLVVLRPIIIDHGPRPGFDLSWCKPRPPTNIFGTTAVLPSIYIHIFCLAILPCGWRQWLPPPKHPACKINNESGYTAVPVGDSHVMVRLTAWCAP